MNCPSCSPIGESPTVRCSEGRRLTELWVQARLTEGAASDAGMKKYASASTRTADDAAKAQASAKREAAWAELKQHIDGALPPKSETQESPATARHG